MKKPSSTTSAAYSASSPLEDSNHGYSAAITNIQPSARTKPTNSTRKTSVDTRVPHLTNNGKTPSNAIYKPSSPTYLQPFTARISFAPTLGPTPYHIGPACTTPPPHAVIKNTPARIIDPNFSVNAHHQYRFVFGDLICFPLQDHERLWKFDVKNDIGFSCPTPPPPPQLPHPRQRSSYPHLGHPTPAVVLTTCDIRRNLLPYSIVTDAVMDLLANRETPASQTYTTQLLFTPALMNDGHLVNPPTPAVIQHAIQPPTATIQPHPRPKPRTALLLIPPSASIRPAAEPAPRHCRMEAPLNDSRCKSQDPRIQELSPSLEGAARRDPLVVFL